MNVSCSLGIGAATYAHDFPADVYWTNAIHGEIGNLLFTDGSAELLSSPGLRRAVNVSGDGYEGAYHFLVPN